MWLFAIPEGDGCAFCVKVSDFSAFMAELEDKLVRAAPGAFAENAVSLLFVAEGEHVEVGWERRSRWDDGLSTLRLLQYCVMGLCKAASVTKRCVRVFYMDSLPLFSAFQICM